MDNEQEFLTLLLTCELDIRAFIGSIVRDAHGCDDLFQEVALTLWKEFHRYDRSRPFGAWARGIASMKLLQRSDQKRRWPALLSPEAIDAVSKAFDRTEAVAERKHEALQECMRLLPEKSRRLLSLRYEKSLKVEQIAQELQANLDAVYQSLSRLRGKLQECVKRRLSAEGTA